MAKHKRTPEQQTHMCCLYIWSQNCGK